MVIQNILLKIEKALNIKSMLLYSNMSTYVEKQSREYLVLHEETKIILGRNYFKEAQRLKVWVMLSARPNVWYTSLNISRILNFINGNILITGTKYHCILC